jgi:DNA-binding NarL/FixJ family response regulator
MSSRPTPFSMTRAGRRLVVRMLLHTCGYLLLLREENEQMEWKQLMALALSQREAEVLSFVAMGKTNADIGIILSISRRTVEKHVEQVLARLGLETRTGAAAVALEAVRSATGGTN